MIFHITNVVDTVKVSEIEKLIRIVAIIVRLSTKQQNAMQKLKNVLTLIALMKNIKQYTILYTVAPASS